MNMTDNKKCNRTDNKLIDDIKITSAKRIYSGKIDVEAQWKRFEKDFIETEYATEANTEKRGKIHKSFSLVTRQKLLWYTVAACVATCFLIFRYSSADMPHGVSIEKKANEKLMLTVTRGTVYTAKLPDGTIAELQPDSRLTYPKEFNSTTRTVELEGEAYFEVAKNKEKPFIVVTQKAEIQVLGTHFNVKAYQEEPYRVSLIEGAVKVKALQFPDSAVMHPGDNICIDNDNTLQFTDKDSRFESRRKGIFCYDNAPLQEILNDICRHYDIEIICRAQYTDIDTKDINTEGVYNDSSVLSKRLHFSAPQSQSAEEIVERLNSFKFIELTIKH